MGYCASVEPAVRRAVNLVGPIVAILFLAAAFTVSLPGQSTSPNQSGTPDQNASEEEIRYATRPYFPQPENAIRVRTDLVEVPVVVRDSNGAAINGLTKDDFEVYDQGKKRGISFFAVETAPRAREREAVPPTASGAVLAPTAAAPAPAPARRPRYVAFYFDDFSMPPGDTYFSQQAAEKFVRESLEPGDKAGIFTSSTVVTQDFTDDKQKLLSALGRIRQHRKEANEGVAACPHLTEFEAYLIMQQPNTKTDALNLGIAQATACGDCPASYQCPAIVVAAARETLALSEQFSDDTLGVITDVINYLAKMPGRRMLVLTSSGFMVQTYGPKRYQEKVIDAALHAEIVINALDAKGLWASPPGGNFNEGRARIDYRHADLAAYQDRLFDLQKDLNDDPLVAMAEGTGGRFFHNQNDLTLGYRELVLEPEVSYVLGFPPDDINPNGSLHTLKVKLVNRKGFTIAARHGYYAPTKKDVDAQAALDAKRMNLDKAVIGNNAVSDIPATVDAQSAQMEGGASGVKVVVHVDLKNLPFEPRGGRNLENLVFIAALFDANGHFQAGQEGLMKLSLKDETRNQLSTDGLNANLSLRVPPGHYRLRQIVQEQVSGRLAASNTSVEIR